MPAASMSCCATQARSRRGPALVPERKTQKAMARAAMAAPAAATAPGDIAPSAAFAAAASAAATARAAENLHACLVVQIVAAPVVPQVQLAFSSPVAVPLNAAPVALSLVTVMVSDSNGVATEVYFVASKLVVPEPAKSWAPEKSAAAGAVVAVKALGVILAVHASPF